MNSFAPLKSALVSSIFAISALMNPALSATKPEEIREKPTCDLDFLMIDTLKDRSYLPTGIKGSSAKWNMEIYFNKEKNRWVLLGQSKDSSIPEDERCTLAWGDTPYTQTTWYQQSFTPAAKPPTSVAIDKTQPKPRFN